MLRLPKIASIVLEKANFVLSRAASVTTRERVRSIGGAVHVGPWADAIVHKPIAHDKPSKIATTVILELEAFASDI
jgi:hypothetical protein